MPARNRLHQYSHQNGVGSLTIARESFLLRTDPKVLDALRHWAEDEFRSANAQLDFILRRALKDAGRLPKKETRPEKSNGEADT